MTDLEKTIDDLKLLNALCHGTVLDDAIALLKRQIIQRDSHNTEYIVKWTDGAWQFMPDVMQELVRCKDCRHGKINDCEEFTTCYNASSCLYGNTRKSNWFCADGVKRDA